MTAQLELAAREYISRRDRVTNPDGKFDKQGRFYPSEAETCSCCRAVRSPSKRFPYSYMVHCRTITHVAHLFGVDLSELRKEVKRLDPPSVPSREGGEHYYKAVAIVDGKFYSIFDGETEYTVGQEMKQAARQGHNGGYYVYRSIDEAQAVKVPAESKLPNAPRAILRIRAEGQYCVYSNGKLAFSRITPIEVLEMVIA